MDCAMMTALCTTLELRSPTPELSSGSARKYTADRSYLKQTTLGRIAPVKSADSGVTAATADAEQL